MFSLSLIWFAIPVCFRYWSHGGIIWQRTLFPFWLNKNFPVPLPIFSVCPRVFRVHRDHRAPIQKRGGVRQTPAGPQQRQKAVIGLHFVVEWANEWTLEHPTTIYFFTTHVEANRGGLSFTSSPSRRETKRSLKTTTTKTFLMSYNCSVFRLFKWKSYMLVMLYSLVHAFNLIWHLTLNSLTRAPSSLNQDVIKAVNVCYSAAVRFRVFLLMCFVLLWPGAGQWAQAKFTFLRICIYARVHFVPKYNW